MHSIIAFSCVWRRVFVGDERYSEQIARILTSLRKERETSRRAIASDGKITTSKLEEMLMLSLWYTLSLANKTDIGHLLKHFYVFFDGEKASSTGWKLVTC